MNASAIAGMAAAVTTAEQAHAWLQLDLRECCLMRGGRRVALTPRAYALLRYLVQRPARTVCLEELLQAVWTGSVVEPGQVKQFVCELRTLLHDDPLKPRFIETVRGRGYRYLGGIGVLDSDAPPGLSAGAAAPQTGRDVLPPSWREAVAGRRCVQVAHGEPPRGWRRPGGAIPDALLIAASCSQVCLDEPHSPLLDAVDTLCDGPVRSLVLPLLCRCAPGWLLQVPWHASACELEAAQRASVAAAPGRMRREFGRLVAELSMLRPVVVQVDDLHDADDATRRLVLYLAMQTTPARVLLLVSTRELRDVQLLQETARRYATPFALRSAEIDPAAG